MQGFFLFKSGREGKKFFVSKKREKFIGLEKAQINLKVRKFDSS